MTRVPPVGLLAIALLGLVVAVIGFVMDWAEVTPVAFFVFVFFTILTAIRMWFVVTEHDVPPVERIPAEHVAHYVDEDHTARAYTVPSDDADRTTETTGETVAPAGESTDR